MSRRQEAQNIIATTTRGPDIAQVYAAIEQTIASMRYQHDAELYALTIRWLRHELERLAHDTRLEELLDFRLDYNAFRDSVELVLLFAPDYSVVLHAPRELQHNRHILEQLRREHLQRHWYYAVQQMRRPRQDRAQAAAQMQAVMNYGHYTPAAIMVWIDESDFTQYVSPADYAKAEARGKELLRSFLNPVQLRQFEADGSFICVGSNTCKEYRIRSVRSFNVDELDRHGDVKRRLCFMPQGSLCLADQMLAQKITLECAEHSALRVANVVDEHGLRLERGETVLIEPTPPRRRSRWLLRLW